MVIVVGAIFLFNALLIDLARIKISENQSENVLKTSLRSTLSAFDPKLLTYGLFGLGINEEMGRVETEKTFKNNFSLMFESDDFKFVPIYLLNDTLRYKHVYSLAHHTIFEHQVLEDMKYRAPIEFTRGVVGKFTRTASIVKTAEQFTKNTDRLESLVRERNKFLSNAVNVIFTMEERIKIFHKEYAKIIQQFNGSFREEEIAPWLTISQSQYKDLLTLQRKILEYLDSAKKQDEEIAVESRRILSEQDSIEEKNLNDVFGRVPIMGSEFFAAYSVDLAKVVSSFSGFTTRLFQQNEQKAFLDELVEKNNTYLQAVHELYLARHNEELKRKSEEDRLEREKDKQINQTQAIIDNVNNISNQQYCTTGTEEYYNTLSGEDGLFNKYMVINSEVDKPIENKINQLIEPESAGKHAFFILNQLMSLLENARDEIYLNQYALSNFNYRTYNYDLSHSKAAVTFSRPEAHSLQFQEIEYLLYGLKTCQGNMSAAFTEIFSVRLAFRTIEALTDPNKAALSSPLLVFLAALAQGSVQAYADTKQLIKGEDVVLMAKISSVKLNYKDYLQFFLFLHSNNHKLMARMQSLIEINTGQALEDKATYIQASAKTAIKLWFIPGLIEGMVAAGFLEGGTEKSKYIITRSVHMSY